MDVSKMSDEAIQVLVDWLEMSRKVSDLSDEELAALGMEFASELPIDSPVYVLVDELCQRVESRGALREALRRSLEEELAHGECWCMTGFPDKADLKCVVCVARELLGEDDA